MMKVRYELEYRENESKPWVRGSSFKTLPDLSNPYLMIILKRRKKSDVRFVRVETTESIITLP